jgi:hypothetical protein
MVPVETLPRVGGTKENGGRAEFTSDIFDTL